LSFAADLRAKKTKKVVIKSNIPVAKIKLEKVVFVTFSNVVNLTPIFLDDLRLLISVIFFCARFTCQKKARKLSLRIIFQLQD